MHAKLMFLAMAAAGLGLSSCLVTGYAPKPIPVAQLEATPSEAVPADAQLALAALTLRLRGTAPGDVERRLAVQNGGAIEVSQPYLPEGFSVRQVRLGRYAAASDAPRRSAAAYVHYEDAAGRRAAVAFRADYRVSGKGIALEKAAWMPLYPEFPEVEMFVVPAEAIAGEVETASRSYASLYRAVVDKALPLGDSRAAPGDERDYLVFLFIKDQLSPDAGFRVAISDERSGTTGFEDASRYRSYDGWPVGVVAGRFAMTRNAAFHVKALYRPGQHWPEEQRAERVIGLFSTAPAARRPAG